MAGASFRKERTHSGKALARLSLRQDTDDPAVIALQETSNTYQFGKSERLE